MKLLIVDDEALVRVGIKTILQVNCPDFEVVGEAENGQKALKMAIELKPDILLVDIRMPVMNGLEFITNARKHLPQSKFIILSCINEFEYARSAMKLGVTDYIIKSSIDSEELIDILTKVKNEIDEKRKLEHVYQHERKQNLINKPIIIKEHLNRLLDAEESTEKINIIGDLTDLDIDTSSESLCIAVVELDAVNEANKGFTTKDQSLAISAAINIFQETASKYCKGYIFDRTSGEIVAILSTRQQKLEMEPEALVNDICCTLLKNMHEYLGIKITIGISTPNFSLSTIHLAYREALEALKMKFYEGLGSVCTKPRSAEEDFINEEVANKIANDMQKHIICNDSAALAITLATLTTEIRILKPADTGRVKILYYKLVFDILESFKDISDEIKRLQLSSHTIMNQFIACTTIGELESKSAEILERIMQLYKDSENNHTYALICQLKTYIINNISNNVSLTSAAEHVKMNPSYISKLFKYKTGESFSDFSTREKIRLAKDMLINNEKLWVIAEKTGYSDITALSRAFKKVEGISPKQYKSRKYRM